MVRQFFKQVSHKAPPTHNEGGAFFLFLPREIKSIFHGGRDYFTGAHTISPGHPMGKGVKEDKGGVCK